MIGVAISRSVRAGGLGAGLMRPSAAGLAAAFRFNRGITESGSGVSQWDDVSGNARHLSQATDASRPAKQADGSILFDGVADNLKCGAFALAQPETVYWLGKQVTWAANDYLFDGNALGGGRILQSGVSPQVLANAGASLALNANLAVDTYGVAVAVFNGASSVCQVNNTTPVTGDCGVNNMGGLTVAASGGLTGFGNVQVKEIHVYSVAHNAAERLRVIRYLARVGRVSL